ncbi:MAG: hypothetical protein AB1814_10160 [Thermodesulfobacteriota bacterium]
MDNAIHEFEDHLRELTSLGLDAQWQRIKLEWEPQITAVLTSAAKASGKALLSAIIQYQRTPWPRRNLASLRLRLVREITAIADDRAHTAKELLAEMVRQESREQADLLTINGLLAAPPRLEHAHPDPTYWPRRLAAGAALDRAVAASLAKFLSAVFDAAQEAEPSGTGLAQLREAVDQAVGRWRSRLKAIAHTMIYSVANRTRQVVSQSLS